METGLLLANDSELAGGKGLPEKHIARVQLGKLSMKTFAAGHQGQGWESRKERGRKIPGITRSVSGAGRGGGKKIKGKNIKFSSPTFYRWDKQMVTG